MIGAGPVDGWQPSHPEHERIWSALVDHAVTPVFHVADQVRVFDDCWYQDDPEQDLVPATEAVFLWVPQFLLMLDGASAFTAQLNGKPVAELSRRPSEYFLDHVRVSSFPYESPKQLAETSGDVFMFCSDYPHSEGTATPLASLGQGEVYSQTKFGLYAAVRASLVNWSSRRSSCRHVRANSLRLARSVGSLGSNSARPGARTRP